MYRLAILIIGLLLSLQNANAQLRTDGYSRFLELTTDSTPSIASGWFALESLPTDTAGLIALSDHQGHHLGIVVARQGRVLLNSDGSYEELAARMEPFRWYHVLLDLEGRQVIINGRPIAHHSWLKLSTDEPLTLWAGKDFTPRHHWGYDLNLINGLIDGVQASRMSAEEAVLQANVGQRLEQHPRLSIDPSHFHYAFSRPQYHLLPAANWTNETHGLIFFNGRYHIFNQKNASNILLRQINWGHFSSPDLIHWTEHRPALSPSEPYDDEGIWSGSAVVGDNSLPEIIYTGGTADGKDNTIALAFPTDSALIHWQKYGGNPVIAARPEEFARTDMRDPYVFRDGKYWYMIVGFGTSTSPDSHGTLLLYRSDDLKSWTYRHLLFEGNPAKDHTGGFWEMPVMLHMGKRWVLSVNRVPQPGQPARTQYWLGSFRNERFVPDHALPRNLEVINRLLSPSVHLTPEGKVVAMAIIPDEISGKANKENGWAHLYSIPREWTLKGDRICQRPYERLRLLRSDSAAFARTTLARPLVISRKGLQKEVVITFYPAKKGCFGVTLYKNAGGTELTRIYFDAEQQKLVIDQSHSSLRRGIPNNIRMDDYKLPVGKSLKLRLFIDGSVAEGFINDEDAFTARVFPLSAESCIIEAFADSGSTEASAVVYNLRGAPVDTDF